MDSTVFVYPDLYHANPTDAETLRQDFKDYKDTGNLPDYFGRDAPYDFPPALKSSNIYHIHLANEDEYFPSYKNQWYRTSDRHLVYCQSPLNDSQYALLAVLTPTAHEDIRKPMVADFLVGAAEDFYKQISS